MGSKVNLGYRVLVKEPHPNPPLAKERGSDPVSPLGKGIVLGVGV